jgi:hypothetical protein
MTTTLVNTRLNLRKTLSFIARFKRNLVQQNARDVEEQFGFVLGMGIATLVQQRENRG